MRSFHHLRKVLERCASLVDNLIEDIRWANGTDDDLILTRDQSGESLIRKFVERHSQLPTFLSAHVVVQLG
jgi:hypothetical protein